jgi:Zn-dependent protease with chaperone function
VDAVEPWANSVSIDERYRPLIERLESFAAAKPRAYRNRVLLAAGLGYGLVLSIALLLVALCAGTLAFMLIQRTANFLTIKLLLVTGVIAWAVLGSLWVRSHPPEGRTVDRNDAPQLFELLDDLRARMGGPHIHDVLITKELNASIVQLPRLGFFGWYRNYLTLGLPLLQSLTRAEVSAVVAHEIGHFAGDHGRMASWIYRVRATWAQLSERLAQGHSADLLRRFFRWYGPWFNAYSFVLARRHEYEADAAAAAATRADALGSALIRLAVQSDRYDRHLESLYQHANTSPEPLERPFASGKRMFQAPPDADYSQQSLTESLSRRTGLDDTHPCLADRLAALQVRPELPAELGAPASTALLGDLAGRLEEEFDGEWWASTEDWWRQSAQLRLEEIAELAELDGAAMLDPQQRLRRAGLTAALRGESEALPLYRAIVRDNPTNGDAAYAAGMILLNANDCAGVELLQDVAARQPRDAAACHWAIAAFHRRSGDTAAEQAALGRYGEAISADEKVEAEAREITADTVIEPHRLSPDELDQLRGSLLGLEGLKSLYLGSRSIVGSQVRQQIVIFESKFSADAHGLLEALGPLILPFGDYLAFSTASDTRWLLKKMKRIAGTRVLP